MHQQFHKNPPQHKNLLNPRKILSRSAKPDYLRLAFKKSPFSTRPCTPHSRPSSSRNESPSTKYKQFPSFCRIERHLVHCDFVEDRRNGQRSANSESQRKRQQRCKRWVEFTCVCLFVDGFCWLKSSLSFVMDVLLMIRSLMEWGNRARLQRVLPRQRNKWIVRDGFAELGIVSDGLELWRFQWIVGNVEKNLLFFFSGCSNYYWIPCVRVYKNTSLLALFWRFNNI